MAERISDKYQAWEQLCEMRFQKLKANETTLNQQFLAIYGLQDYISPEIADHSITVRKANLSREIKSLISYAIGCSFGRYSLDHDGLCYAGGIWDASAYQRFLPVNDNILLLCDGADIFENDLLTKLIQFIRTAYGAETLEENLAFMAQALGGEGSPCQVLRSYLLHDFYADHCRIYHKKPIYWLFSSGRQKSFQALIYYHRWKPETLFSICHYLPMVQAFYLSQLNHASVSDQRKISRKLKELQCYITAIHKLPSISLSPDDGIINNYHKLDRFLAKIN